MAKLRFRPPRSPSRFGRPLILLRFLLSTYVHTARIHIYIHVWELEACVPSSAVAGRWYR